MADAALPDRVAIPDPRPVHDPDHVQRARRVRCPDCDREFPAKQAARYELHWRLTHDVRRAL